MINQIRNSEISFEFHYSSGKAEEDELAIICNSIPYITEFSLLYPKFLIVLSNCIFEVADTIEMLGLLLEC